MYYLRFLTAILTVSTIVACVATDGGPERFTSADAHRLLTAYVEAVRNSDSTAMSLLWSESSHRQRGFWQSLHITIGEIGSLSALREFLSSYNLKVTGLQADTDHYIVEFDWILKDTLTGTNLSPRIAMRHYVVNERGRFVLINPIDVLTKDWHSSQADIYRFIYPARLADGDHIPAMAEMESRSREILDIFDDNPEEMIEVYVTPDAVECGELLLQAPSGAYACISRNLIVSTTFVIPHELIHILCARRGHDVMLSAAFAEGIAMALGGSVTSVASFSPIQAKNIINSEMYVPLGDLITSDNSTFLRNAQVTYHEAGALFRFLIDRFGLEKVDELYDGLQSANEGARRVRDVYGYSIEELEEQWISYLDELNLPETGAAISDDAQVVFALADAIGDDFGNGDYLYPSGDQFAAGVFDLTSFEVLEDNARVYFKLGFQKLGRSVFDESTGVTYAPGALIAIRRGYNPDKHVRKNCEGIAFSDNQGYDLRLDIGVQVIAYDSRHRMIFATRDIRDSLSNYDESVLEFSLPKSFIGNPDETWGFFASTVLMHDHGLGFVRSFPRPVTRRPSKYSFGGGRADRNPPHIDILLPAEVNQKTVLGGRRPMVVPMLRSQR